MVSALKQVISSLHSVSSISHTSKYNLHWEAENHSAPKNAMSFGLATVKYLKGLTLEFYKV